MSDVVWRSETQSTVSDLLDRRLAADADGAYLDVMGTTFTAAEIETQGNAVANGLIELGVGRSDRVASLLENDAPAALFWWGAIKSNGIAVPINTAYKGEYLRHQLADSASTVVVVQADLADRLAAVAPSLPELRHVIVVGEGGPTEIAGTTVHRWDDLLGADTSRPPVTVRPSDLGTFIYTGGTTGPSKGCMLSHNYHESIATQINICWRRTADDVVWTPLPLFHFNAVSVALVGTLLAGGRSAIYRKFSVSQFWPEMNRTSATVVSLLGSMAYLLSVAEPCPEMPGSGADVANRSLRLMGAAPMPAEIDNRLRERFGIETFSGAYGLTEASLVSWQPMGVSNKPGAAGVINDEYFDVRIFDDDDVELPRGADGEIVIRPKRPHTMFEGYWGRHEATVEASRNWWFHTGDIGRIDDEGFLYFVDRKADYLRRRGENISSFEVEKILLAQGGLADVAVHAVPSELTEDDLKVTAVRKADTALTEEELFRYCIEQLPYFALPRYIEFRDDLPRSPVGRVLKRDLRDEGVTEATWDVEASGITYEKR